MSGIHAALEYTNCMPSSKPLAAAATWLGWNARLKLSLSSWTRGAAQKRLDETCRNREPIRVYHRISKDHGVYEIRVEHNCRKLKLCSCKLGLSTSFRMPSQHVSWAARTTPAVEISSPPLLPYLVGDIFSQFVLQRSRAAARRLLAASIVYLPLLFVLSATLCNRAGT